MALLTQDDVAFESLIEREVFDISTDSSAAIRWKASGDAYDVISGTGERLDIELPAESPETSVVAEPQPVSSEPVPQPIEKSVSAVKPVQNRRLDTDSIRESLTWIYDDSDVEALRNKLESEGIDLLSEDLRSQS